ncbi:amidohydrolase, partial [Candidatus Bathyarchaeota archaeon]|nr:amidohydrolase [Candidatus Bathyarchaeota archaeon]
MVKDVAINWINDHEKEIIGLSDKAWEYAEVGLQEYKTSELFSNWIEKQGFEVERGVADMPTAFVASWSNGEGSTIGLMGELDALA